MAKSKKTANLKSGSHNPSKVERKVHFFRVDVGQTDGGKLDAFDPAPALGVIEKLTWGVRGEGRYLKTDRGYELGAWVDRKKSLARFRLGAIRTGAFPQLEEAGNIEGLAVKKTKGLIESTHVVAFNDNILGVEYNFFGPRSGAIADYLQQRGGESTRKINLLALQREDAKIRIGKLEDVRMIALRARPSFSAILRDVDQLSLADAFDATANIGSNSIVEIIVRAAPKQALGASLLKSLKALVGLPATRENALKFLASGESRDTSRIEIVDLLGDDLVTTVTMMREDLNSRAIESRSAYEGIEMAYESVKDQLKQAVGIQALKS